MIWKTLYQKLPEGLAEFAEQMRPTAIQCLPIRTLAPKLIDVWRQSHEENRQDLLLTVNDVLPAHISAVDSVNQGIESVVNVEQTGKAALEVYFSQLKNPHGVFLDLRERHFFYLETQEIEWCPSAYQYQFPASFRTSLLALYNSFYRRNEAQFHQSLLDLHLLKSDDTKVQEQELKDAILKHFGEGRQAPVSFNLKSFRESFTDLFKLFVKQKKEIPADFFFLGLYLFSLYAHLEHSPAPFPVKDIFLSIVQEQESFATT